MINKSDEKLLLCRSVGKVKCGEVFKKTLTFILLFRKIKSCVVMIDVTGVS